MLLLTERLPSPVVLEDLQATHELVLRCALLGHEATMPQHVGSLVESWLLSSLSYVTLHVTIEADLVHQPGDELLFFGLALLNLLAVLRASIQALRHCGQVLVAKLLDGSAAHGACLFLDLVERVLRAELLLQEVVDAALLPYEGHVLLDR